MSQIKCAFSALLLTALTANAADIEFGGLTHPAITEKPSSSTGLEAVYVLPGIDGVVATFTSESGAPISWQRFSAMGAAYAQPIESTQNGNISTLTQLEGNMGYVVTQGDKSLYFWVIDYSSMPFEIREIELSTLSDCSTTWLDVDGSAPAMTYYSINGVPTHINREITLSYQTLEFDSESFGYRQVEHIDTLEQMSEQVYCTPALCQTDFTISGDRFSRTWGEPHYASSPVYDPTAVALETSAEQEQRDVDNEVSDEATLGGSGPVDITFRAAISDAVVFHQWELARDSEFNQVFMRREDLEFTQTFDEQGTTYVRMLIANDAGNCEAESEVYEVFIGESSLKCPNAFSPGTSEGTNDEWKVSYKSITKFDCNIFDRNGRRLAHLTHPSQGWDGKINGKVVPSGVYFYVIRAEGTDGKKYKLSGDINVIGFKKGTPVNAENGL